MSGESLSNLIQLLPSGCLHDFNAMRLVTPARRLLHEIEARYPGADVTLATGPGAAAITAAVVESLQPPRDLQRDAQR